MPSISPKPGAINKEKHTVLCAGQGAVRKQFTDSVGEMICGDVCWEVFLGRKRIEEEERGRGWD